ncbi:YkvA family protein [Parabacteroides pacaensis]|uniref:YkvA family protein n=1 Tax=Parabacteroides pacaensis TaxID=2086575 RepID=UPI00131EA091|nr:DUF1232 domain-containing protein [Parabacteroides pacaensis]
MSESKKIKTMLDHLKAKASEKDVDRINQRLGTMRKGTLRKRWGEVLLLWGLARDKNAPWFSKATAIAGLLYVIIPFDVIPDVIPFLGLTDDVAAVAMAVATLGIVLNKYKKSRQEVKSH